MRLQAFDWTIKDLLSGDRPLIMAPYQRRYEWTTKEMEELLSDLVGRFRSLHPSDDDGFYFLGSFILQRPQKGPMQIIDGQQRITSLSIALARIRDCLTDIETKQQIDAYLTIPADKLTGAPPIQRIALHRGDNNFFTTHILPMNSTSAMATVPSQDDDSLECLRQNTLHADGWIRPMDEAQQRAFAHFITKRCRIVTIQVDNEDDALGIFETVNSRGRPLRSEDVLRYGLIEFAATEESRQKALLKQWDLIEKRLGQRRMPRFLAQLRARRLQGRHSNKSLHRDIIESFESPATASSFLKDELRPMADAFLEVATARLSGAGRGPVKREIDRTMKSLGMVDFQDWLPIAVVFVQRFRGDPGRLLGLLKKLDRLAWLFHLRHARVGHIQDRNERFGEILRHALRESFDESIREFDLTDSERAEMRRFIEEPPRGGWPPLRLLLVRLELTLKKSVSPSDFKGFTIEHVLPKKPTHRYWFDRFDGKQSVIDQYSRWIGNLCLLPVRINKAIDDLPFPEKRTIVVAKHADQRSSLAADFGREADWSKDIIERRTKWLRGAFCDEFDVSIR